MPTLNRFPLFGLWNRVAAELIGYDDDEARSIGHGVAVLYAIRARGGGKPKSRSEAPSLLVGEPVAPDDLMFGGDPLPCEMDEDGRVLKCLVGAKTPKDAAQTPESYQQAVEEKIPEEYLERLRSAMNTLLATYSKPELNGRLLYDTYDDWKKAAGTGRRVDLDQLVTWLEEKAKARAGG